MFRELTWKGNQLNQPHPDTLSRKLLLIKSWTSFGGLSGMFDAWRKEWKIKSQTSQMRNWELLAKSISKTWEEAASWPNQRRMKSQGTGGSEGTKMKSQTSCGCCWGRGQFSACPKAQSYSVAGDLLVAPPLDRQLFTVVAGNSEVFV